MPHSSPRRAPSANAWLFAGFLLVTVSLGGASRADALSQPVVRLAALGFLGLWLFKTDRRCLGFYRELPLLLGAGILIAAIQLAPLPAAVWTSLPGRQPFVQGYALAGLQAGWHGLSLTPDRTLNSLLAFLPPLAAAAGLMVIERREHGWLVPGLLVACLSSALVAIMQLSTNGFYLYEITNQGAAVGLFANRNHQALLLAAAIPLLACWTSLPHEGLGYRRLRSVVALMCGTLLLSLLLVTGSRAGLLLGFIAAVSAFVLVRGDIRRSPREPRPLARRLAILLPFLAGAIIVAATLLLGRDEAAQRFFGPSGGELRAENLPIYWRMFLDFFPFGSGLGSFEAVFRAYEPTVQIDARYMNQAHNDLAQVMIETGLPGLLLILAGGFWFARRAWALWRTKSSDRTTLLGRTGSIVGGLILISSLVDYPLRTPTFSVIAVVVLAWMLPSRSTSQSGQLECLAGVAP